MNINAQLQSRRVFELWEVNESNFLLEEELRRLRFEFRRALRSVNDQVQPDNMSLRIDAMVSVNILCAAPYGLWVES